MGKVLWSQITGIIIILITNCACDDEICDRRPLGTKTEALRPDNQFVLEIENVKDNKYIPGTVYSVILRSAYENASFIAFTISLKEDIVPNKDNPRKPTHMQPGRLELSEDSTVAKYNKACVNTVIQSDVTAKTRVEVKWHAPGKDNKCVSIFAVVAVTKDIWYSYEPPLSLKVCEDPRKSEDMPPPEVDGVCDTCEDARYRLRFEGLWSYNTHPDMFPAARELARFSDLVGAAHSPDARLFSFASEATVGLKMLAEQGNTTQFEMEIQDKLPTTVRTVIKATSPEKPDMSTVTSFRASPQHHRLSIAVGILPSPDWFLGVSQLELCDKNKKWESNIKLNLYPIDAGTDKGLHFESSNEEQSPFQVIAPLEWIGKVHIKLVKPFARLVVERVRTYATPQCAEQDAGEPTEGPGDDGDGEETGGDESGGDENGGDENGGEDETEKPERKEVKSRPHWPRYRTTTPTTTTTSEEPPVVDPGSSEDCPVTAWEEWEPCSGVCVDGAMAGLQTHFRHHIVDGLVATGKNHLRVSEYCLDKYPDWEARPCHAPCPANEEETTEEEQEEEKEAEASRRTWRNFIGMK